MKMENQGTLSPLAQAITAAAVSRTLSNLPAEDLYLNFPFSILNFPLI
ncbi:hypothetical protein [Eubacterium callanderi]|nr:hypothetical protein [Eubacterium callanderi]